MGRPLSVVSRARSASQLFYTQAGPIGGIALPLIRRNEDIRLERDSAADVDGIHAAQDIGFQAGNRLGQNPGRAVANCRVLNVSQQQRLDLPILGIVDFAFPAQTAKGRDNLRQGDA
jgi:hypothetical protein